MSGALRLAGSVAWYGLLAIYNRTIRFSRVKGALLWQLVVLGLLVFIARRVRPVPDEQGVEGLVLLMALQMGWFGLMFGFSRSQFQLYQGVLVPLFQITPARPLAFLIGRMLESVPMRLWNSLLWGWAYSAAMPGAGRWAVMLLLVAVGVVVGLLADLTGRLLVLLWARVSPKGMRYGSLFFGLVTMAVMTYAVIFLSGGGNITDLAMRLRGARTGIFALGLLAAGIPGLFMLGALLLRPTWVEDAYRTGLFRLLELGEQEDARPGRSTWLPLPDGAVRGILSKEWLQWSRSMVTRIQAALWVCATVGVYAAGRAMVGQPLERVVQFVGALSLLAWGLAFSHWVVRVFEVERAAIILYRLTAVPTATLLWGKFLAVFLPSAVMVALSVAVGGAAAGLDGAGLLTVMAWSLGALAAGTIGGFGAAAATAGQEPPEPEVMATGSRNAPQTGNNAWYILARLAGLLAPIALVMWTGAGQPWAPWRLPEGALLAAGAALPLTLLLSGYWLMTRWWDTGNLS